MCRSERPLSSREPVKPRKCQVEVLMQEKHGDASCACDCYHPISTAALQMFFFFGWGGRIICMKPLCGRTYAARLDFICEEEIKRAPFQQLTSAMNAVCTRLHLKGRKNSFIAASEIVFFYDEVSFLMVIKNTLPKLSTFPFRCLWCRRGGILRGNYWHGNQMGVTKVPHIAHIQSRA